MTTLDDGHKVNCNCKVGKMIDKYDLSSINSDLVARWTGEQGDDESIRALTDWFNHQLLRVEMHDTNMEIVEGSVENLYELLTDEDRLKAVKTQAQSTLERNGVNVDRLEEQFLSHQTMYRHLRDCLNAEKERNELTVNKERNRIHSVQNKAEAVTDDSITRLRDGGKIDIDEFEVLINFRVTCESCGTLYDVSDFLSTGGCDCK